MEPNNFSSYIPVESAKYSPIKNPKIALENVLSEIFPQPTEENKVYRTRQLLGSRAQNLSDEEIETIISEFDYLINTWLDVFEKNIFQGMTLKEILKDKEYATTK